GSSSIVGKRRAGKTWLLEYLQLLAPDELGLVYRIGYIDATHPRSQTQADFVQSVLENLNIPVDPGLQPLMRLSQGVHILRGLGITPVLCIDEFERLSKNRAEFGLEFFEAIRALAQDNKNGLILVTASMSNLTKLIGDLIGPTSPLINIVELVSIPPFTEE